MIGLIIALAAGLLFVTFLGKPFGAGAEAIARGVSAMVSPQIRPAFVPTLGVEFTGALQDWWEGAKGWLAAIGIQPKPLPGAGTMPLPSIPLLGAGFLVPQSPLTFRGRMYGQDGSAL